MTSGRAFREAVEPYVAGPPARGVTKLSISLPSDLAEILRAAATDGGTTVSALITAALRRAMVDAEQEQLDAALVEQNEENAEFARAYAATAAKLLADLEW